MTSMTTSYTEEIYKTYATAKQRLGTKLETPDGRVFRFSRAGAVALAPGKLHQAALPIANHLNCAVQAAAAIGATSVVVTFGATAGALNLYKDGYLAVNDATGEGHYYRVKSHAAIAGSDNVRIYLYEDSPLKIALTTSSEVTLVHNKYQDVLIHASPPTATLVGVALCDVTIAYYCWLQTRGPCNVLTQGTLVIGDFCVPSATVDGAVMPSAAFETDGPLVGRVMRVNADTEYSMIDLALE